MSLTLIQITKGEAYDADGILHECVPSRPNSCCDNCGGFNPVGSGWESSQLNWFVCDDCVHVVSIESACDAIEQVAALKNAFEFIFGKSKCKTNDEIILLYCHDCKKLIKFGQDVRWIKHSYCTDCFFEDKHDAKTMA